MDITGKIEEVNQSDSLLLVVFYADIWHLRYFGALLLVTAGIIIVNKTTNNKKSNTSN
mgnify:CR=1 FL=1